MTEKKRKVWLTPDQVSRMLDLAKEQGGERDWLLLSLMRYGFRVGEIVGRKRLPGIYTEDLRPDGIWIKGKGYAAGIVKDRLMPVKSDLLARLVKFAPKEGKLFPISEQWAEEIVKRYARLVGVEDWQRVSPHRLRAFFNTDMQDKGFDIDTRRQMMRHKNIQTTMIYERDYGLSQEKAKKVLEALE